MELQQQNFGLNGFLNYDAFDDNSYDYLLKKFREKRQEKKEERKQRKDDKRSERQEKRELNTEKKRLKNDLKQTQIDERKSQLSLLTQSQSPSALFPPTAGPKDNSMMIVAAVIGVVFIAGIGYVMTKKNLPLVPLQKAA
jgi:hypothetical protein